MIVALWTALAAAGTGAACVGPDRFLDEDRPRLSGPAQVLDAADRSFRVHTTDEGADAAPPGLAELALDELLVARDRFQGEGWRALAPDDGSGGSPAIDLYVQAIDANGYANPADAAEDQDGSSCFLRVDPDVLALGEATFRSVVAHELHHCVQYRYSVAAPTWWYEGQATFAQYADIADDPVLSVALAVLWTTRLRSPERPVADVGGRFEYAALVFFKFLADRRGTLADLPAAWEAWDGAPSAAIALEDAASLVGARSFVELHAEYGAWLGWACARDVVGLWSERAACTAFAASAPLQAGGVEGFAVTVPAGPYALALVEVPPGPDPALLPVITCTAAAPVAVAAADGAPDGVTVGLAEVQGRPGAGPRVVALTSAEVAPVDAACTVRWQRDPAASPEPTRGCASTPQPGAGLYPLVAVALLRRRRANAASRPSARAPAPVDDGVVVAHPQPTSPETRGASGSSRSTSSQPLPASGMRSVGVLGSLLSITSVAVLIPGADGSKVTTAPSVLPALAKK
jgi:uncharacterized protein (TIGR03382 family)